MRSARLPAAFGLGTGVLNIRARPLLRTNLMARSAAFFGREREQYQAQRWLTGDDCRLLTIHGPAGIGKTAFAAEVGRQLHGNRAFRDGAWRVELESLPRDALESHICSFIMESLA